MSDPDRTKLAAAVDLWAALRDAAVNGDEQSEAFLAMFGPWLEQSLRGFSLDA
jgi:hypothetical protein